jgi:hypothetical protein
MGKDPLQKKPHKPTPKPMLLHEILLIKDVWQFGTTSTSKEHFNSLKTNGPDANGKKVYSLRPKNNVHFTF